MNISGGFSPNFFKGKQFMFHPLQQPLLKGIYPKEKTVPTQEAKWVLKREAKHF